MATVLRGGDNFDSASGFNSVGTLKAWVNFNGQGTVAIRASGNVSSITDLGVGNYRANFTTAIQDANYSAVITITTSNHYASGVGGNNSNFTYSTTSFGSGKCISQGGVIYDPSQINISIHR